MNTTDGILGHNDGSSSSYSQSSSSSSNGASYSVGSVGSTDSQQQQENKSNGSYTASQQYSSNAGEEDFSGNSAVSKTSYFGTEQEQHSSGRGWSTQPHDSKVAVIILLVVLGALLIGLGMLVHNQVAVVRQLHNGFLESMVTKTKNHNQERGSNSDDETVDDTDANSVDTTAAQFSTTTEFICMDSIIRTGDRMVTTEVSDTGVECQSPTHSAV